MLMTCTRKCKQAMHAIRPSVCSNHFHQNDKIAPQGPTNHLAHQRHNQTVWKQPESDPGNNPETIQNNSQHTWIGRLWQGSPVNLNHRLAPAAAAQFGTALTWFVISFAFATNAYNSVQLIFSIIKLWQCSRNAVIISLSPWVHLQRKHRDLCSSRFNKQCTRFLIFQINNFIIIFIHLRGTVSLDAKPVCFHHTLEDGSVLHISFATPHPPAPAPPATNYILKVTKFL